MAPLVRRASKVVAPAHSRGAASAEVRLSGMGTTASAGAAMYSW